MSNKELIAFVNWLWDMDYLKINFQLQPFNNAESSANHYIKVRELKNNAESQPVSKSVCSAPNDEHILYRCAEVNSCDECPYKIKTD